MLWLGFSALLNPTFLLPGRRKPKVSSAYDVWKSWRLYFHQRPRSGEQAGVEERKIFGDTIHVRTRQGWTLPYQGLYREVFKSNVRIYETCFTNIGCGKTYKLCLQQTQTAKRAIYHHNWEVARSTTYSGELNERRLALALKTNIFSDSFLGLFSGFWTKSIQPEVKSGAVFLSVVLLFVLFPSQSNLQVDYKKQVDFQWVSQQNSFNY